MQQHGVEVAASLVEHHLHGLLDRERIAIDTVAGERVEHVGDRHDAPLDGDLLGGESTGVAAAIPALVM